MHSLITFLIRVGLEKMELTTEELNKTDFKDVFCFEELKKSLEKGDNVYLRGFGSFIVKKRAQKTARNISQNTTIIIPEHNIPAFKPAKTFVLGVKK